MSGYVIDSVTPLERYAKVMFSSTGSWLESEDSSSEDD